MMTIKEVNIDHIFNMAKNIPSSTFYADLLNQKNSESLEKVRFYVTPNNLGFLSINSKSVFNIYSNDLKSSQDLLSFANKKTRPKAIFANDFLHTAIEEQLNIEQYNPYLYLKLSEPKVTNIDPSMSFRTVRDASDQNFISDWPDEFNRFKTTENIFFYPIKTEEPALYLFFKNDSFLGGLSNMLEDKNHFWAGRFMVFEKLRRKGHGSSIIDIIESAAALSKQSLHLHVNTDNTAAVNLFLKRGFKQASKNAFWLI